MAGRPPKPTALKRLQGNPGHRPLPKGEPQPTPGVSSRPGWLSPEAKREWTRIAPELERLGLLTVVDRAALAVYCQSWAMYVDAVADVAENGPSFVTDKGYEGPRASVGIMVKMISAMSKYGAKFGLTPSDRGKMQIPGEAEEDEFTAFLSQKKGNG